MSVGKIIFWIVLVFGVLFALRLVNGAKAKRRASAKRKAQDGQAQAMVRCARCGVFLPRVDAKPAPGGFSCGDVRCTQRQ